MSTTVSLRERKKQQTRYALEDTATKLVLERGLNQVTVEDICAPVGVSKRTFFNYFAEKEEAILGTPPEKLGEQEKNLFLSTELELPEAVLTLMLTYVLGTDTTREWELYKRRHTIVEKHPELHGFQRAYALNWLREATTLIETYLVANPEKSATSLDPHYEAHTIANLALSVIFASIHTSNTDMSTPQTFRDAAFHTLKSYRAILNH
ncbi:TetR/AcrR family transcriptional regulator [Corynebacterium kutscheri]|uniref:TetR/AcrR family transcriptional regulator n=1 Tax=Corynebacterium kutscheri TaxID=35755 RepID=UPI0037C007AB